MLNTVVLSDLHFGEPYNLIRDQGVPPVLNVIKAQARGRVRRLVLAGDIFEMSTPESMDAVRAQSRFFLSQAAARFRIDEVIWVPGNHDYSLFRRFFPDPLTLLGAPADVPRAFVDEFFGPGFTPPVRVAYPHLALHEKREGALTGRSFVIHHGHLLDDLILGRTWSDRLQATVTALTAGRAISPRAVNIEAAQSLEEIEAQTRELISAIWRHHDNPDNFQNEAWDLVRRFTGYAGCELATLPAAAGSSHEELLLDDADVKKAVFYLRAARRHGSWPRAFAGPQSIHFVVGHTHHGGTHRSRFDGVELAIENLGGWVVEAEPTRKNQSAHTHIFLINDDAQSRTTIATFPDGWAGHCIERGKAVFAIPGVDDELIAELRARPPMPGMPVAQIEALFAERPFSETRSQTDPFA